MHYEARDGRSGAIEVLTVEGFVALTEQEKIPDSVPLALDIVGVGDTYRVEDVVKYWPAEPISQEEFDRRLNSLRRGIDREFNPFGAHSLQYLILDQPDTA